MQEAKTQLNMVAQIYVHFFPNASASGDLQSSYRSGGHFCEALREGRFDDAVARADFRNSMILYWIDNAGGKMIDGKFTRGYGSPLTIDGTSRSLLETRAIQFIRDSSMVW
jgi:hypothetical protein